MSLLNLYRNIEMEFTETIDSLIHDNFINEAGVEFIAAARYMWTVRGPATEYNAASVSGLRAYVPRASNGGLDAQQIRSCVFPPCVCVWGGSHIGLNTVMNQFNHESFLW